MQTLKQWFVLNRKLYIFEKPSPPYSFCNLCNKTPFYTFYECNHIKFLWSDLVQYFKNGLVNTTLTPQTAIFGFLDSTNSDSKLK